MKWADNIEEISNDKKNEYDIVLFTDFTGPIWGRALGAYRVATYLRRRGYRVRVLDLITDFTDDEMLTFLKKNISDQTKVVGFSTTFFYPLQENYLNRYNFRLRNFKIIDTVIQYCRENYQNLKIISGGPSADVLKDYDIDLFFYGYAETEIDKVLFESSLAQGKHHTSHAVNFEFDKLDTEYVDSDFLFQNETLAIEISRGCRFKCKFCSFPLNGRKPNTYFRTQDSLRDELIRNYEQFGTISYFFADDTYNESVEKLKYFNDVLLSLPFKIEYTTYLRLDLLYHYPEMVDMLKKSGLSSAFFGIETLNDKSAKCIGKGFGREKTLEALSILKKAWGSSVQITTSYIIGLPFDTPETVNEWFQLVLDPDFYTDKININPLMLAKKDKGSFKSIFDEDPEKFGYRIDSVEGNMVYWSTNDWSYKDCFLLANQLKREFNNSKKVNNVSFFGNVNLRGYGFTRDEITKISVRDQSDTLKIKERVRTRIDGYKQKALNY